MKNTEAMEIAVCIRTADTWDEADLAELCSLAGLKDEWNEADGETFEAVAFKAAELLGVEIA